MSARARLVLLVLVAGCKRETVLPINPDVTGPGELDFGAVALGVTLPLELEVKNRGLAGAPLTLSVSGPFTLVGTPPQQVEGGSSVKLTVAFAPTVTGAATGTLSLGMELTQVRLRGEGVPACVANEPCTTPRFDLVARACVSDVTPDDSACTAPCLGGMGTCKQGLCLGQATRCVDGDACTLDACSSDGGCFHPARECPVLDPCQATFCDPVTGCSAVAVDDGVPCGEAFCEGANICFGGHCQFRARPNAAADCRYTALSAGPSHTCVVTAGRALRCWGSNSNDQQARGFTQTVAPPGFAAGFSQVRSVAAAAGTTWVSREPGELLQTNAPAVIALNATGLAAGRQQACGLESGALRCAEPDGGLTDVARDVTALSMSRGQPGSELCFVDADGGVRCMVAGALVSVPLPGAASAVAAARPGTGCALVAGRAVCWGTLADAGLTAGWDAGATTLAAAADLSPVACASQGRRVECVGGNATVRLDRAVMPANVTALALGALHGCALLDDGKVTCWGANTSGQLGDRSNQPLGVQRRAESASWLTSVNQSVVFESGGVVRALDSAQGTADDAGSLLLVSSPTVFGGARDEHAHGCHCARVGAGVTCEGVGPLPGGLPAACRYDAFASRAVCVSAPGGSVHCYAQRDAGVAEVSSWDAGGEVVALRGPAGPGLCALRSDGQVRCNGLTAPQNPESATGVRDLCLGDEQEGGGCARLDGGVLSCWGPWVGSAAPRVPLGAWPVVREVACGARHVCALAGTNIVQCWGENEQGQLGRDGPASVQAVGVPMPEAVVSIAAGGATTCALLQSGALACWGDNFMGQLGVPALNNAPLPRVVRE